MICLSRYTYIYINQALDQRVKKAKDLEAKTDLQIYVQVDTMLTKV